METFTLVVEMNLASKMGQGVLRVEADHIDTAIQIAKVKGWIVLREYKTFRKNDLCKQE